ncbi:hypothetical protein [Methylobacterium sp. GC_Met_2]|uniref:hypothetical protein n=1 Tax=Methylobacterium sp. GC_Met_2 TaxID=2937376 RepID=UPI00226B58A2|nr:hypothetical protein [Methylobacterium sp. GC_Met_2]
MRSQSLRAFVEVSPDCFVPREQLPLDAEALAGAATMLKAEIRKAIGGMAPLMGEDTILRICREVMAEDCGRSKRQRG